MIRPLFIAAALVASPAHAQADDEPIVVENYRIKPVETVPAVSYRIDKPKGATRADVMKWEAAYLVLSAIDGFQTARCFKNDPDCEELNPLQPGKMTVKRVVIGKIAGGLLHFALVNEMAKRNPKFALRIAQISVGVQAGVVGFNLTSDF